MKSSFPYKRLGPRSPRLLRVDTLWMGADHLLSVRNRRFTEEYTRFDLREIQAIIIRKQPRFGVPVYLLLLAVAAWIAAGVGSARHNRWLEDSGWAALALIALYWLAAAFLDSSRCHLQTATGVHELHALSRYRSARRVLGKMQTRIEEAQGTLPEDWDADDEYQAAPPPVPRDSAEPMTERPVPALWSALACCALLGDALFSWLIRSPHPSTSLRVANQAATLIAVGLPIAAIIVSRSDLRFRRMRRLLLVAAVAVGMVNYGNLIVAQILISIAAVNKTPVNPSVDLYFFWANQLVEIGFGSFGLLYLLDNARRRQPSAP